VDHLFAKPSSLTAPSLSCQYIRGHDAWASKECPETPLSLISGRISTCMPPLAEGCFRLFH
jgi:hypothetical protein